MNAINTKTHQNAAKGTNKGKAMAKAVQAPKTPEKAAAPVLRFSIDRQASASEVQKFIGSIASRGAKLDTDIHSAAVACLYHADKHGDITLMERLLQAMPKSGRRNALMVWALNFGPFLQADKGAKKEREDAILVFSRRPVDIEAAAATPFWTFKNVREGGDSWVYADYIKNVMKMLSKHADTDAHAKAALEALKALEDAAEAGASAAVLH